MATLPVVANDPHQQFLARRREFVGGSDSASLFPEDSKYGCDVRLFFDKQGKPPDYPRTQREENILKRGHIWEEIVAKYFQEETGLKIRRIGSRVSKTNPIMGVNMDRQIIGVTTTDLKAMWPENEHIQKIEGDCGPGYLECKTTNEYMFKQMMAEGITTDYIFQVNHGLKVTGYKWGVFAVLEPTWGQFATFPFVFMESLGEEQDRRAAEFWANLQAGKMPEPKVNDQRCKSCIYRRSCPRSQALMADADKVFTEKDFVEDDSPELVQLVSDYREALEVLETKETTVANIKKLIQEALGDRPKVEVPSCGVRITWKENKAPLRWDGKALEGTAQVLQKFDIPQRGCNVADCSDPAVFVLDFEGTPRYFCEIHGVTAMKEGGAPVARKGVSDLIMDCRRPGTPSKPFTFKTL